MERPLSDREGRVVDEFMQAWRRCDVPALAAVLRDDVQLSMPPEAQEFRGRDLPLRPPGR